MKSDEHKAFYEAPLFLVYFILHENHSQLHHLRNWSKQSGCWLSNISDIKKNAKTSQCNSELLTRSWLLTISKPAYFYLRLPPTQEQSVKWLINVHFEKPHGQRKPHVDINAQSMPTDNTANRSLLGGQTREQTPFLRSKPSRGTAAEEGTQVCILT